VSVRVLVLAVVLIGCNADIDEPWELDHDRIIAVRAEPPGIEPGEQAQIDVLLGYEALPVEERSPDFAQVVSPESLANTLSFDGAHWVVTAPSEARINQARGELGLLPDAPVPLRIGIAVAWPTPVASPEGMNGFAATKVVWLGQEGINPPINGLSIGGVEPEVGAEIVFSKDETVKTRLSVEADDGSDIVNWLTSCGTMHDFDLATSAYVTVGAEDRVEGQFALVLRDELGGVSWRVWSCRAE